MSMLATVAIIGRPNVGKSTLFNRLAGKKLALVSASPGVTRDLREATVDLGFTSFCIIDTAGLEESKPTSLKGRMREQTQTAMRSATLILIVVDGRNGITPMDYHYGELVRRSGKDAILVVNKAESRAAESSLIDAYSFGFGDPIAISAEHGDGITDLLRKIESTIRHRNGHAEVYREKSDAINLAIAGRPNTGKSTLFNALVGESRALTGPDPGVTHDSIHVDWQYKDRHLRLIDTAGLRRRTRIADQIEGLASADTLQAIRYSNIAILMLDAANPVSRQDLAIAEHIASEGRGLVICANKWDLVSKQLNAIGTLTKQIQKSLPQVRGVPIVTCSAIVGNGIEELMLSVFEIYEQWTRRLPTAALNRWLEAAVTRHPPPLSNGKAVKLRYISQYASRPPRFILFTNRPKSISASYTRYLVNDLRNTFDFFGVPIRLSMRAGKNPYVKR